MNNVSNSASIANKGKKKKRGFNFVDFLLIIIALAIIGGVIYLFSPISFLKDLGSQINGTLDYTVEIRNVDVMFIENIKENDVVIDSVSKNTIGTVSAIDHNTKYTELDYRENADGQYEGVFLEYPDRYNITVTITADAEFLEGQGYSVNNCRVAVGEKMSLRFKDYVCQGYCVYVTPSEDFK